MLTRAYLRKSNSWLKVVTQPCKSPHCRRTGIANSRPLRGVGAVCFGKQVELKDPFPKACVAVFKCNYMTQSENKTFYLRCLKAMKQL